MTRALVLGGGGPVGIGWESGLAVGLADGGVDLAAADAFYGTSAGSFVGAELALGLDMARTATHLLATSVLDAADANGPFAAESMAGRLQALTEAIGSPVFAGLSPQEAGRALGRLALEADVPTEEDWLDLFGLFHEREWPSRFACTAVEAVSAEFVVWRSESRADLQRAVASSCAVPIVCPPVTIAGRRYMDGGVRSSLNADLAAGHDQVVVISVSPLAVPSGTGDPVSEAFPGGGAEIRALRSSGSAVEVIEPNAEFLEISGWGVSLMDVTKAAAAYEAGARHGYNEARRIADLWEP